MPTDPRFSRPVNNTRPFRTRRYDVFSPKLGRGLTIFGRQALDLWVTLEASPSVLAYCERPVLLPSRKARPVDFWIANSPGEEFLVIRRSSDESADDIPNIDGVPVRYLDVDEVDRHMVAVRNWGRIVRDLAAFERYIPSPLPKAIAAAVGDGKTVRDLQASFSEHDPDIVRIAIFQLLHRGLVRSPMLAEREFSSSLAIELPCPPQ